jgi:hypothetical protein
MYALYQSAISYILCGNYVTAAARAQEQATLAEEKGALSWKGRGMASQGCALGLTGRASDAIEMLLSAIAAWRTSRSTILLPFVLPHLAHAYAQLGQFEKAWRCIGDAMTAVETAKEKWCEAEVHRVAGEIALMSQNPTRRRRRRISSARYR